MDRIPDVTSKVTDEGSVRVETLGLMLIRATSNYDALCYVMCHVSL